jgi:hypothetical protein
VCNLFHPNERIHVAFVGPSRLMGKGYWKIRYINLTDLALNLCPGFERSHMKLLSCFLWCSYCWV